MNGVSEADSFGAESSRGNDPRLSAIVRENYQFLWRSLRRLGLPAADVDDAAQQVLLIVARRLDDIAEAAERAFLFQTALRVASDKRKANARSRIVSDDETLARTADSTPNAEAQLDRRDARALLEDVLDAMAMDLRVVFVLFELEEMSTQEIAKVLEIPQGTVSSRLYRARHEFEAAAARARARHAFERKLP